MAWHNTVTSEAFVRAWQAAKDTSEVAEKLGLRLESVRARGYRFRKKGVPLKRFSAGRAATDWTALKQLAESLGPKSRKG